MIFINESSFKLKIAQNYSKLGFYLTSMLLRLLVVVDAHEEDVAGVAGYLCGIFLRLIWSMAVSAE